MKNLLFTTLLMLLMVSCDKFVEPKENEVDGDLKGCFELTGEKYDLVSDDNGASFTAKVRRTEQSVPFAPEVVAPFNDGDKKEFFLAGFGYTLFNKEGKEILTVKPEESKLSVEQVTKILSLKPGEEADLTINVPQGVEPAKISLSTVLKFVNSGNVKFEGAIGKYGVKNMEVEFNFAEKVVKGKYQYKSSPAGVYLWWNGRIQAIETEDGSYEWEVVIVESNDNGGWCGDFAATLQLTREAKNKDYYFSLAGDFTNFKYDNFKAELKSPVLPELYKEAK